jgi:hypothetical protein
LDEVAIAVVVVTVPPAAQQKSSRFASVVLDCSDPQGEFGPFGQQSCVGMTSPQANAGTPAASRLISKIDSAMMWRNILKVSEGK